MSLCFTVLASVQTLYHTEAWGEAASFDSRPQFLSVICLAYVYCDKVPSFAQSVSLCGGKQSYGLRLNMEAFLLNHILASFFLGLSFNVSFGKGSSWLLICPFLH